MATPLPRILNAVPQTLHVRFEIAKAVHTLAAAKQEGEQPPTEVPTPAELDTELIKECARELRREFLSLVKSNLRGRRNAIKAAVDDPKHPGWPAGTPDGKGGEFRPKDIALGSVAISAPTSVEVRESGRNHVQLAMEGIDPFTGVPYSGESIDERMSHFPDAPAGGGPGGNLFGGGGTSGRSIFSEFFNSGKPPNVSEPAPTTGGTGATPPPPALSPAQQLSINRATGAAFENEQFQIQKQQGVQDLSPQITVRTQSGIKTRLDIMGRDQTSGEILCIECKSSDTAPPTRNQSLAFPQIEQGGATVVGRGKPGFPGGTVIPPTQVQIIRPSRKVRMAIDQTNVVDFMGVSPNNRDVLLFITDHLGWTGVEREDFEHMYLLQEKINTYVRFIESGEIDVAYPKSRGRTPIIKVLAKYDMPENAQEFFKKVEQTLLAAGYQVIFEMSAE